MNSQNDNDLMEQVSNGDVDKLSLLFEKYHVMLYNYFFKLTKNKDLSQDMVQDVFFRILKYRHTYRGQGKFFNWMFNIARNIAADQFKKRKYDQSVDEIELVSEKPDPGKQVESDQYVKLLEKALNRLPFEKREVLILSRFQNRKYEEISKMLNVKVGTVKARVHRAIKELREIYLTMAGEERYEV